MVDKIYYNIVNFQIYLTLQSPNMISVIEAVLWLHLRICTLGKFVIFYDIAGFERGGFLQIISETVEKP